MLTIDRAHAHDISFPHFSQKVASVLFSAPQYLQKRFPFAPGGRAVSLCVSTLVEGGSGAIVSDVFREGDPSFAEFFEWSDKS
jgi:hypothetical protein